MQKLVVLLGILLTTTTLFGAYDVKIAVYKNSENLHKNIAKIQSSQYKKHVRIEKKNHLYYAHAILNSKSEAKRALKAYKPIFKDAFIAKKKIVLKEKKTSVKHIKKSKENVEKKETFLPIEAEKLLNHKTIYLCYEKSPKHLKNRVVRMDFSDQKVTYTALNKKNTVLDISCVFKDSKVVLNLADMNITHEISEIHDSYLSVKNSLDGVTIYILRYYFDKKDALEFVKRN